MQPIHYFVHVPKTAGVTVRTWLRRVYRREELIFVYDGPLAEAPDAQRYSIDELLRRAGELSHEVRMFFGHYSFSPERLLHDRCRGLGFVRDPAARIVSWRRYVQKHGERLPDPAVREMAAALNNGEALRDVWRRHGGIRELDNGIVRMFADWRGPAGAVDERALDRAIMNVESWFDFVGHIDWFDDSMRRIAALLDKPWQPLASANESAGGRSERQLLGGDAAIDPTWLANRTVFDRQFVAWISERFPPPAAQPPTA